MARYVDIDVFGHRTHELATEQAICIQTGDVGFLF